MIRSRENIIGARAFLIGIFLALIVGVVRSFTTFANPFVMGVLAILGIVVGFFVADRDAKTFLLAGVSLVIVSFAGIQGMVLDAAISGIQIGKIVSSILGTLLVLFVPATIIVAIKMVFSVSTSRND